MKTVGDKVTKFAITGVKPGQPEDAFFTITDESFAGKWKVVVYYPKDFTFVCPTEIVAYDKLAKDFEDRDAVLLTGSTDNEFCKVAWQKAHPDLQKITHIQFADTARHGPGARFVPIFAWVAGETAAVAFPPIFAWCRQVPWRPRVKCSLEFARVVASVRRPSPSVCQVLPASLLPCGPLYFSEVSRECR